MKLVFLFFLGGNWLIFVRNEGVLVVVFDRKRRIAVRMPFPMKIQPIDCDDDIRTDQAKPVVKSRLKRLFEWQFPGVLRISSSEKLAGAGDAKEIDPSSLVLDKMVLSFMEDGNEKSSSKCGRNHRCHCFHGSCDDSSDDDLEFAVSNAGDAPIASPPDAADVLKVRIQSRSTDRC